MFNIFIFIIILNSHCFAKSEEPSTFVFPPFWATIGFHKVTQTEIYMFLPGTRIISPHGIAVTKLNSQDDPKTIDDDEELTGYAVDAGANLMGYNPTFTSGAIYGQPKKSEETFNQPHGVCATPEGYVYVADTGNKRILIFYNNKGKINYIHSINNFNQPYDVSFDVNRNLYITDKQYNCIKIFDKNNKLLKIIKHEKMNHPTGIIVVDSKDIWHYYKEDFMAIINNEKEIMKFTLDGEFMAMTAFEKLLDKKVKLEYLTADYYSQILITDSLNHTIHKLDRNLNYITSFGHFGTKDFEFVQPRGIDIWRRFGQLFITELTGGQYFWVGVDIINLTVKEESANILVNFKITEPAILNMALFQKEKVIKVIMTNEMSLSYQNRISFPKPLSLNKKKEEYILRISAIPTYSSRRFFKKVVEKKLLY